MFLKEEQLIVKYNKFFKDLCKVILNIVIIGCGHIGSRHLQALSKIQNGAMIYLVDSSPRLISTAIERFEEVVLKSNRDNFKINVREINKIRCDIDIAIISTTSKSRAILTKKLISNNRVKYIIFEKFLFQDKKDFKDIQNLLKLKKIKSWVNQWMSSSFAFNEMKDWFGSDLREIKVDGKNWDICCNSVHYLEYLDFISLRKGLTISDYSFDNKILKSKRPGYFELTGMVTIQSKCGVKMTLISHNLENDNIVNIHMLGKGKALDAIFSGSTIKCTYISEFSRKVIKEYDIPLQSDITGDIVEQIFYNGSCSLPTYDESMKQHLKLFDCFKGVFEQQLEVIDRCAITKFYSKIMN